MLSIKFKENTIIIRTRGLMRLLILLTTILFTTGAIAQDERNGFYLKGELGGNKINNTKQTADNLEDGNTLNSKSEFTPIYTLGLGYYINDIFRTDITLNYSSVSFDNAKGRVKFIDDENDEVLLQYTLARKSGVHSIILNNYADFNITDDISVFFAGGVGVAQIKEKLKLTTKILLNNAYDSTHNESISTKPKINFAYSLTIGASTKITDNVHIELAYSWKDYGKTHPRLDGERTPDKAHYRGHHVGLGIRFDL
jgi:opacity protein-like surface antigen